MVKSSSTGNLLCRLVLVTYFVDLYYIVLCFYHNLTYCAEIWGNTYKSNTHCIFLLQKKIVRIVYGANFRDHTDVIFQDLKFYDLVNHNKF